VLVYETKSGPSERHAEASGTKRKIRRVRGKQGIIMVAQVSRPIRRDSSEQPRDYDDRPLALWCWIAPLSLVEAEGFVPLAHVNRVLEYRPGSTLRGFGPKASGLKEITATQYAALVELFLKSAAGKDA